MRPPEPVPGFSRSSPPVTTGGDHTATRSSQEASDQFLQDLLRSLRPSRIFRLSVLAISISISCIAFSRVSRRTSFSAPSG